MKTILSISLATIYGLSTRLLFDLFPNSEIMSLSFLILAPLVIGFLTVHFIPNPEKLSKLKAFFMPWLSSLVILFITILVEIEGVICWIMIYPLFSIVAGIGGLIAYHRNQRQINKNTTDDSILDDWNPPTNLKISLLLLLPFIFGAIEGDRSLSPKEYIVTETITIPANTSDVWAELLNIGQLDKNEKSTPFSNLIGFPQHLSTSLDTAAVGGKRIAYYENGLFFEETILDYIPNEKLILDVFVDPKKVPANVMDEHIVIGGKHVDLLEDEYHLVQIKNNLCELTLSSRFEINTPFNWYAGIWAEFLMQDLLKGELKLIKERTLHHHSNINK